MLAATIRRCREWRPCDRPNLPERDSFRKALAAAKRVLRYTERRASHASSIPAQCEKLREALNNGVMWLSLASPSDESAPRLRVDCAALSAGLPFTPATRRRAPLSRANAFKAREAQDQQVLGVRRELVALIDHLEHVLSAKGKPPGRPKEDLPWVVRGGCIAWLRAGRKSDYQSLEEPPFIEGPLVDFLNALLAWCRLKSLWRHDDLHYAIKEALKDTAIKNLAREDVE